MSEKQKPVPDDHLIDVEKGMDALDVLEERLDRLLDRLNALWDRAVGLEAEGKTGESLLR
jgi:hypothetical protein